jgi:hypothetical protein
MGWAKGQSSAELETLHGAVYCVLPDNGRDKQREINPDGDSKETA